MRNKFRGELRVAESVSEIFITKSDQRRFLAGTSYRDTEAALQGHAGHVKCRAAQRLGKGAPCPRPGLPTGSDSSHSNHKSSLNPGTGLLPAAIFGPICQPPLIPWSFLSPDNASEGSWGRVPHPSQTMRCPVRLLCAHYDAPST